MDGQEGLVCCDSWGRRVGHDWATELNRTKSVLVFNSARIVLIVVFISVASPSFSETDHVTYLCGVRLWARREGPLWPQGLGTASLGRSLEPDRSGSAQACPEMFPGEPFTEHMVPSWGNLRTLPSSCLGLSCWRPCYRVSGVARSQGSTPPGCILPLVLHSYQTV